MQKVKIFKYVTRVSLYILFLLSFDANVYANEILKKRDTTVYKTNKIGICTDDLSECAYLTFDGTQLSIQGKNQTAIELNVSSIAAPTKAGLTMASPVTFKQITGFDSDTFFIGHADFRKQLSVKEIRGIADPYGGRDIFFVEGTKAIFQSGIDAYKSSRFFDSINFEKASKFTNESIN